MNYYITYGFYLSLYIINEIKKLLSECCLIIKQLLKILNPET